MIPAAIAPAAVAAAIRAIRAAAPADRPAAWDRHAAPIAAAIPGDDAPDAAWAAYDRAMGALDHAGMMMGLI